MVEILTERLSLRPFRADDLVAFVAYRSAPKVARYQSWDTSYSMADAERFLAAQQRVAFGGPGASLQLAAIDRVSGTLCGDCAVASERTFGCAIGLGGDPSEPRLLCRTERVARPW